MRVTAALFGIALGMSAFTGQDTFAAPPAGYIDAHYYHGHPYRYRWHGGYYNYHWRGGYYRHRHWCGPPGYRHWCYS